VLLPLLLAPVYALGGRTACVALMALAAAALAFETFRLCERATGDRRAALWGWAAVAGPPLVFYSFHVYTEVPSGLALTIALRLLSSAPNPGAAALAALLAAALPWLHLKMIPAAAALGCVALVELRGRSLAAFLATASLAAAAFLGYYHWIYGVPSPLAVFGGHLPAGESGSPPVAALGLLLDRSFGLLPHAPLYLLSLAALPRLVRQARALWRHALLALAVLAPVLAWRMWWGGQCPPGRFLVPLLPMLGLAVAVRVKASASGLARWRWPLAAGGGVLASFMMARPADLLLLNRADRPTRVWLALSGDVPVSRYLPSLVRADAEELRVALVWVVALGALLTLDWLARSRERCARWFRGLGLPVILALALGAAVDGWARRTDRGERAGHPSGSTAAPEKLCPGQDTMRGMYEHLPGGDLVEPGLRDLAGGIESVPALLVASFATRLRREGIAVPEHAIVDPEHRLYELLAQEDPDSAHGRYNALVRRLVSFARALPCAS
jgi:hypothetical protein